MVNKPATKGGEGEEENRDCRKGGPTKLPAKGGGQQQRPGKEEPLVERRQEGTSDHSCATSLQSSSSLQPRLVTIQASLLCNFPSLQHQREGPEVTEE